MRQIWLIALYLCVFIAFTHTHTYTPVVCCVYNLITCILRLSVCGGSIGYPKQKSPIHAFGILCLSQSRKWHQLLLKSHSHSFCCSPSNKAIIFNLISMNALKINATLNDLVSQVGVKESYVQLMSCVVMLCYIALHCNCVNSCSTWVIMVNRDKLRVMLVNIAHIKTVGLHFSM